MCSDIQVIHPSYAQLLLHLCVVNGEANVNSPAQPPPLIEALLYMTWIALHRYLTI